MSNQNNQADVKKMLQQAYQYLKTGTEHVFEDTASDHFNFLIILKNSVLDLIDTPESELYQYTFEASLYQAESLARLAADVIFLEVESSDQVNFLCKLKNLLVKARELHENNRKHLEHMLSNNYGSQYH